MDIVSHALIGTVIAAKKHSRKLTYVAAFFSFLPDLTQIPLYLIVGKFADRWLWIPQNIDWIGFRELHPLWSMLWEIPHSFFFLLLIIVPIVFWFKIPKIAIAAYGLHIIIDLFSHSGEWAVKPFYPLSFSVSGFTDAWAWHWQSMLVSWLILIVASVIISKVSRRKPPAS